MLEPGHGIGDELVRPASRTGAGGASTADREEHANGDAIQKDLGISGEFEYSQRSQVKPVELSSESFSLGKRLPAGRSRWVRYDLSDGPEVLGLWWQNIGLWAVVITLSGPEARRAELEAHANTLFAEMPFPSAPPATSCRCRVRSFLPICRSAPRTAPKARVRSCKPRSRTSCR